MPAKEKSESPKFQASTTGCSRMGLRSRIHRLSATMPIRYTTQAMIGICADRKRQISTEFVRFATLLGALVTAPERASLPVVRRPLRPLEAVEYHYVGSAPAGNVSARRAGTGIIGGWVVSLSVAGGSGGVSVSVPRDAASGAGVVRAWVGRPGLKSLSPGRSRGGALRAEVRREEEPA